MSAIEIYKKKWVEIPAPVRKLVVTGIALLIIWKLLYTFWLQPNHLADAPLTRLVAYQTAQIMQFAWPDGNYAILEEREFAGAAAKENLGRLIVLKNGKPTISIADNCNGLELMVLYAAFILCLPGKWSRKILFILAGIPILHTANLLRCAGLVGMHLKWPGSFDFAHHYLFKIVVYGITFLLWVAYLKPITGKNAPKSN